MKRYAKEMMDSNSLAYVCSGAEDEITYKETKKPLKHILRDFNPWRFKGANTK